MNLIEYLGETIAINPIASAIVIYLLIGVIVAYVGIHIKEGFWAVKDLTEFILVMFLWFIAVVIALVIVVFDFLIDDVYTPIVSKLNEAIKNTNKI